MDEAAFRTLIRHVIDDVDGLVPCGTTGEFNYLTPEENKRLVQIAVEEAEGKPVIAGTGAPGTKQAIELARDAQEAGATACLVVCPYFLHPSDKGIYQHYYEIAKALPDMPIILYNIPQVVDAYLPRRVVEDLADIPNIVGLKDSSGNLTYTMEILEYAGDRINVLVGHDEVVLNALAGGVQRHDPGLGPGLSRGVAGGSGGGPGRRPGDGPRPAAPGAKAVAHLLPLRRRRGGQAGAQDDGRRRRAAPQPAQERGRGAAPRGPGRDPARAGKAGQDPGPRCQVSRARRAAGRPVRGRRAGRGDDSRRRDAARHRQRRRRASKRCQIDLLCGAKDGPLGEAWAYQLTYPRHGYEALTTILEPNLTVRPSTLIVPANELKDLRQANMIYGPVQNAVAKAIVDKLAEGVIPEAAMHERRDVRPGGGPSRRRWTGGVLHHNAYAATCVAIDNAFAEVK